MSEHEIERRVEFAVDRLDKRYLRGELSQREYDRETAKLDQWAQAQYDRISDISPLHFA